MDMNQDDYKKLMDLVGLAHCPKCGTKMELKRGKDLDEWEYLECPKCH